MWKWKFHRAFFPPWKLLVKSILRRILKRATIMNDDLLEAKSCKFYLPNNISFHHSKTHINIGNIFVMWENKKKNRCIYIYIIISVSLYISRPIILNYLFLLLTFLYLIVNIIYKIIYIIKYIFYFKLWDLLI